MIQHHEEKISDIHKEDTEIKHNETSKGNVKFLSLLQTVVPKLNKRYMILICTIVLFPKPGNRQLK